jgi:hypothetical protein
MADLRMKTNAAAFLVALLRATSASAGGADAVVGTYYEPYEDNGDGYYPETLKTLTPDGHYEINVVDHGSRSTFDSTYSVQGDQITVAPARFVHKCSWSPKIVGKPAILSFQRTKENLTLSLDGDDEILPVATPEQIKKVMAVPPCAGQ